MTPEETKWRASVYAPEKIRRKLKLQYWLLGAWSVLAGAWVVVLCTGRDTFGWMTAVVLLAGYANILLGIVNHRRLLVGTTNANGERTQKNTEITKNEAMSSIFTRIIAGEIPSYKVAEDENYYAFLDINPLTKGHTLVVPKMEVDYIFDLDDKTLAGMMLFAKKVAAKIKQEIACKRVAVVALGLEVPHAHIHLIPIQSENDVDFHREKLKLTPEEFREIADKLSK